MKVSELQAKQGNIEITLKVKEISEPKEFSKFGMVGKVANAMGEDDSGTIKVTLWNDQIDKVKVGDTIKITKGYVSEWQGEKQLSTGKFGILEVIEGDTSAPAPKAKSAEKTEKAPAKKEAKKEEPSAPLSKVEDYDDSYEDDSEEETVE